ncbi:hypothetical protein [Mycobacterium sp.]|uniref:hypothetical protein n=1 Tax=Mycobacterium sp. TaxID=1785 RepID=UPI003F9E88FE
MVEAAEKHLNEDEYVWMDVFCHNQHAVGSVADQMEAVISRVERLLLPMSAPVAWFDRAWCIWEVLCAIKHGKKLVFLEYAKNRRYRDFMNVRRYYIDGFKGIEAAGATFQEDKQQILGLAEELFGGLAEANNRIIESLTEQLGPDAR